MIILVINFEIGDMSCNFGFYCRCIYEIVIVGNVIMCDIVFNMNV